MDIPPCWREGSFASTTILAPRNKRYIFISQRSFKEKEALFNNYT
jgi:hypothetical protein